MATQDSISPTSGATDVARDVEVVIQFSGVVDINTLNIAITGTVFAVTDVIVSGAFVNEWTGEIIDNGGGSYTVVIIRPIRVPRWKQGTSFIINGSLDGPAITGGIFTTVVLDFAIPAIYSNELVLTSLPAGWANQTSGTGLIPLFSGTGMETRPGAAGTSFIRLASASLNFFQGFLIDIEAELPTSSPAELKIIRVNKGGQGLFSVNLSMDPASGGEIWIEDVVGKTTTGFRPAVAGETVTFRLAIKGDTVASDIVARLYAGTTNSDTAPLLQQSLGPSENNTGVLDCIDIGSLESGDDAINIVSAKIDNLNDPEALYPFPSITNIKPTSGELSGGESLRIDLQENIDLNLGDELFFNTNSLRDDSTGAGSIGAALGNLSLVLSGGGTGRAAATYINALNGDLPSGVDFQFNFTGDNIVLTSLPFDEVVVVAAELASAGDSLAIELVADAAIGTFFRAVQKTNNVEILSTKILDVTQAGHVLRFTRAFNNLVVCVNGVPVFDTTLKQGSGILTWYSRTDTLSVGLTSTVSNFIVRPVVTIGESPVLNSGLLELT